MTPPWIAQGGVASIHEADPAPVDRRCRSARRPGRDVWVEVAVAGRDLRPSAFVGCRWLLLAGGTRPPWRRRRSMARARDGGCDGLARRDRRGAGTASAIRRSRGDRSTRWRRARRFSSISSGRSPGRSRAARSRRSRGRLAISRGPTQVRAWIEEAVGSAILALTPYRVGAHEVVLGADCARRTRLLQGTGRGAGDRGAVDTGARGGGAGVVRANAGAGAARGRHSLVVDGGCPGQSGGDAHRAAETLARIQQRVFATARRRSWPPSISRPPQRGRASCWASRHAADIVRQQCARVTSADVPATWIPMDLDPTNILIDDDDRVRFIDVDDSFLGPAPLAVATLALRWRLDADPPAA